ncbi:hypothetical protein [Amycolatopsis sp. MEPSY49]|uniref:hypothetical protein n=1 Tax=Amycolatopsis sp. MEPSY49 TaxID=3151600 RepID=UPI003EF10CBB
MLTEIMAAQDVTVEAGDILCVHTGLTAITLELGDDLTQETLDGSCAVLDSQDGRLLQWITDSGLSAIVADNLAVERFSLDPAPAPNPCCRCTPTAFSSRASRWARGGTWRISPADCASTGGPGSC